MSHYPSVYASLLKDKMHEHDARCVLLNTGWSGGPAGQAERISIKDTRALLDAALDGKLDDVDCERHPVFNLKMPKSCPDINPAILNPRNVWKDTAAYDAAAGKLRDMFRAHFGQHDFSDFGIEAVM
jgi:phosphoenolpyruvate carboxykinase (ATP)